MKFSQVAIGTRIYINSATTGWLVLQGQVKAPGDEVDAVAALPPDCTGVAAVVASYDIMDKTFNTCKLKAMPVVKELKLYRSGIYTLEMKENAGGPEVGDTLLVNSTGGATVAVNLSRNAPVTNGGWLCALKAVDRPVTIQADGDYITMDPV